MSSKVTEMYDNTYVLLPGNWLLRIEDKILPCDSLLSHLQHDLSTEIKQTATSITVEVNGCRIRT